MYVFQTSTFDINIGSRVNILGVPAESRRINPGADEIAIKMQTQRLLPVLGKTASLLLLILVLKY
jgi:hypothetical protein